MLLVPRRSFEARQARDSLARKASAWLTPGHPPAPDDLRASELSTGALLHCATSERQPALRQTPDTDEQHEPVVCPFPFPFARRGEAQPVQSGRPRDLMKPSQMRRFLLSAADEPEQAVDDGTGLRGCRMLPGTEGPRSRLLAEKTEAREGQIPGQR